MLVYSLFHRRNVEKDKNGEWVHEAKQLGYYSFKSKAEEAISFYLDKPGFCDYPNDFVIDEMEVKNSNSKILTKIYEVTHEYEINEEENIYDMVTYIGYYATEKEALEVVEKMKQMPEFAPYPDGFIVDCYLLNDNYWCEGFTLYE